MNKYEALNISKRLFIRINSFLPFAFGSCQNAFTFHRVYCYMIDGNPDTIHKKNKLIRNSSQNFKSNVKFPIDSNHKQYSKTNQTSILSKSEKDDYIERVRREITRKQLEIKHLIPGSFEWRMLNTSITNLSHSLFLMTNAMGKTKEQQCGPSCASLEVLSTGTDFLNPCVALRTPTSLFLFDCPENIHRYFSQFNLRSGNLSDIFLTKSSWGNAGGLFSLTLQQAHRQCMDKEAIRLHGGPFEKSLIDILRPFNNAPPSDILDISSNRTLPIRINEIPFSRGGFENHMIKVDYIPLTARSSLASLPFSSSSPTNSTRKKPLYFAYLVEIKPTWPKMDIRKLVEFGVPKGPMIRRLQMGESVTLDDGKVVNSEDVTIERCDIRPRFLVVNCPSMSFYASLEESAILTTFKSGNSDGSKINYIVHLTDDSTLNDDQYSSWMASFGSQTVHLIVNNHSCPVVRHFCDSRYRHHRNLNTIHSELFPKPFNMDESGDESLTASMEPRLARGLNVVFGRPFQQFLLRGHLQTDFDHKMDDCQSIVELKDCPDFDKLLCDFVSLSSSLPRRDPYPRLTILGTSSASATKYRNVSGYLLEFDADRCCLLDCGEGTFGQLLALYGRERTTQLLRNVTFLWLSHDHTDHVLGMFTIILERKKAFFDTGVEYKKLCVIASAISLKHLSEYSMQVELITNLVTTIVCRPGGDSEERIYSEFGTIELGPKIASFSEWSLKRLAAVKVNHPRMAKALIIVTDDDKKLVYSGDTAPCFDLIRAGLDADLLIHEATFGDWLVEFADKRRHSTIKQAVKVARKMNAKNVVISHFSARYKMPDLPPYLDSSNSTANIGVAQDLMVIRWDQLPLLSKMLPLCRSLFHVDLAENSRKDEYEKNRLEHLNRAKIAKRHVSSGDSEPDSSTVD